MRSLYADDTIVGKGGRMTSYVITEPQIISAVAQGNLINAIGYLIAADVGLATVAGLVEFAVIGSAVSTTIRDIESLIP